jgi:hypothetical protein
MEYRNARGNQCKIVLIIVSIIWLTVSTAQRAHPHECACEAAEAPTNDSTEAPIKDPAIVSGGEPIFTGGDPTPNTTTPQTATESCMSLTRQSAIELGCYKPFASLNGAKGIAKLCSMPKDKLTASAQTQIDTLEASCKCKC